MQSHQLKTTKPDSEPVVNRRAVRGVSRVIPLRIKASKVQAVRDVATSKGMDLSSYVRSLINKDTGIET